MPRLLLLQVFAGQLLLSGALGLLHVFLQFFQQVLADKLLFLCVSAQLLVFIHGNPVGEKVLCRQILESPAAEAALDNCSMMNGVGCSGYLSITSFSNSASLIMYSPPSRLPSNVIDFYPLV